MLTGYKKILKKGVKRIGQRFKFTHREEHNPNIFIDGSKGISPPLTLKGNVSAHNLKARLPSYLILRYLQYYSNQFVGQVS